MVRNWRMQIFPYLAILTVLSLINPARTQSNENRVYGLLGHGSLIEFRTFTWMGEDQLLIRFTFQTRSYNGQLLRLIGTNQQRQPVLEIKVSILQRIISIYVEDFDAISNPVSYVHFNETEVSDGLDHKFSITVDPDGGDLLIELDDVTRPGNVGLEKSAFPLDTTVYMGGAPGGPSTGVRSVIGCVGNLAVLDGADVITLVKESEGDVGDGCLDACDGSACAGINPTGCLNFYLEPKCDCVGTGKEGALCNEDPKVYHFDGDQYIAYQLSHHDGERQPRRIHVSFKAEHTDQSSSLLLLYARSALDTQGDSEDLAVIVNKASIQVYFRREKLVETASKHELINARWHEVTIDLNYPKMLINVKVDNEDPVDAYWSVREVLFNEIYFGGYKTESDFAPNFHGCLRMAYVDLVSIGGLIDGENSRISFGKSPLDGSCPLADMDQATDLDEQSTSTTLQPSTSTMDSPVETPSPTPDQDQHHHPATVLFDEQPQPASSTSPPVVTCADLTCKHGTKCVQGHDDASAACNCEYSGYVGTLCQFSNLPRTCDELYDLGERRSGVFRIDPDGNGPMEPVQVVCEMNDGEGGTTHVDHNFVNGTYVRQRNQKDTVFMVEYRNMTLEALKILMANSETCEQYFKYECNQAPLMLYNSTWFRSVGSEQSFSGIGSPVDDKQCPCGRQRECGSLNCYCDSGEKDTRVDDGFHPGQFAGITQMTYLQHPSGGWAKVSLGPLSCQGSRSIEDVVQFRKASSILKFSKWKGQQMSFWFRTSMKTGRVFSQSSSIGKFFNLNLEEGHTLVFTFNLRKNGDDAVVTKHLVSQSPLNDAAWHRVTVETAHGQVRLGIDNRVDIFHMLSAQETLDESTFDREFIFGGAEDDGVIGYIGCVRQLSLNKELMLLSTQALPDGVHANCQSHCTSDIRCFNNAECIEDYQADSFQCKCVNQYSQFGTYCEKDINIDTEISVLDASNGYVLVRDFAVSPVANNRLVFSVRTDQTSALLMFAHDENYNMVQIHLVDGNRISLTVNYEKELLQCTIVKKTGDFNNMQWFQVVVSYSPDHTSLFVDKEMCQIDGGRVLSSEYLEEWAGDIQKLRVVFPPRPPVKPSQMPAYTLLYVGGVRRARLFRSRRQSRQIVYTTSLPNLLGCVRGFVVGEQVADLRNAYTSENVKPGCSVGCDDGLRCGHGGYCKVDWASDLHTSCYCTPTSYFGPYCTLDHGLHFDGTTFVHVELELILQRLRVPEFRSYDSVSFAFSTDKANVVDGKQLLAVVSVNSEKDARVYLMTNGQLALEIRDPGNSVHIGHHDSDTTSPHTHLFPGDYKDGERHLVFLKFFGDKLVSKVDGHYHEVPAVKWRLSEVNTVSIGGAKIDQDDEQDVAPYTGCMSNALIEFRSSPVHSFALFDSLLQPQGIWYENYQRFVPEGNRLHAAQCAQYSLGAMVPTEGPPTALPPFTASMQTLRYIPTTQASADNGKGTGLGVIIGLAVVILVVLLCVALYVYYAKCVKGRRRRGANYQQPPENGTDHTIPATGGKKPAPNTIRPDPELTELPEANEDLDNTSNDRRSSSPPPPYIPTATPPPTPPRVAAKDDPQSAESIEHFPPPPTDQELKSLTPSVQRNRSIKRGAFVYGFPDVAYVDAPPSSPKPTLAPTPSFPRRMPVHVPIPKI